jgi:hypothetical protein
MITGSKSPYYEETKCKCGATINRRKGVSNPICSSCRQKKDRDRKRGVLHISKKA